MEAAGLIDIDRFTRRDVAQHRETQRFQRDRLAGDDVLRAAHRLVHPDDERANAERVAKRQQAVAGDHRYDRVRAAAASMHAGDRGEDRVRVKPGVMRGTLEL